MEAWWFTFRQHCITPFLRRPTFIFYTCLISFQISLHTAWREDGLRIVSKGSLHHFPLTGLECKDANHGETDGQRQKNPSMNTCNSLSQRKCLVLTYVFSFYGIVTLGIVHGAEVGKVIMLNFSATYANWPLGAEKTAGLLPFRHCNYFVSFNN